MLWVAIDTNWPASKEPQVPGEAGETQGFKVDGFDRLLKNVIQAIAARQKTGDTSKAWRTQL